MILNRFNKVFNISTELNAEFDKFSVRLELLLFKDLESYVNEYDNFFKYLCFEFGEDPENYFIRRGIGSYNEPNYCTIRTFTAGNFQRLLGTICVIYNFYKKDEYKLEKIDSSVKTGLKMSTKDLGVRWHNGMFYPAGDKKFDIELIEQNFDWLDRYQSVKKYYREVIKHYTDKEYPDAVGAIYNTMEELARKILNNDKVLNGNKGELISCFGLSSQWAAILSKLIDFCNEYKRHASEKQSNSEVSSEEAEAMLYLTGIFLRLASEK